MKVIENYKAALENSDENFLREVFVPQVRVEIPAGATLNHAAGYRRGLEEQKPLSNSRPNSQATYSFR